MNCLFSGGPLEADTEADTSDASLLFLVCYYELRGDRGFEGENISNAQPHASSAGTTRRPGS